MAVSLSSLANYVKVGKVVEVESESNTAIVEVSWTDWELTANTTGFGSGTHMTFSTVLNSNISHVTTTRRVKTLTRGSKFFKDYFNYSVGEKVICVFPSGGDGYIIGTFFDAENKQPDYYEGVRLIKFGDNYIEINLEENTLDVKFEGSISINGKEIYLNG